MLVKNSREPRHYRALAAMPGSGACDTSRRGNPGIAAGARLSRCVAAGAIVLGLLALGCGEAPETAGQTELDLYKAIARGEVRYALLTKQDKTAEARTSGGALMTVHNFEDLDALAAVLSKERVEYYMQDKRSAQMPE